MDDESIGAENRADEITSWLNGLKVSVALRICRAYTKKKLSSLKILSKSANSIQQTTYRQYHSRRSFRTLNNPVILGFVIPTVVALLRAEIRCAICFNYL